MGDKSVVGKSARWKQMTRGGQTFLHNLRMINQVLNKVLLWTLPVGLLVAWAWFTLSTTHEQRFIGSQWFWAQFNIFFDGPHHLQKFLVDNQPITAYSSTWLKVPFVKEAITVLTEKGIRALWAGGIAYALTALGVLYGLRRYGQVQSCTKHIKGDRLAKASEVKKRLHKKGVASSLCLAKEGLPLPMDTEMQHFLIHGTTGCGKSNVIKAFLEWIRKRGDRAIVYDKSCTLVQQFYTAGDPLLNPFDERTTDWSLWPECRDKADFESLAAALIPISTSNEGPFWTNAARTIFAAAAFRLRKEKHPKILQLLHHLLTVDTNALQSLLKGTEAETLISDKVEKMAVSIKAILATYLKSLCFVKDGDNPFSIRQWIQNDAASSWLFISSLADKHESLKPLITAWLDIAVNALLSLPEQPERRIWVILDELTSLQQLPYLTSALSEARKFGGCFVVGIQSYAQLAKTYGHEGGREISSLLNTRFFFRMPDPDIAVWSARNLGEQTVEEAREGISYGANTLRDGVSVNRVEVTRPLVTPSEIHTLENLHCFLRLPGDYPITRLQFDYPDRPVLHAAFIPRVMEENDLRKKVLVMSEEAEAKRPIAAAGEKAPSASTPPRKKSVNTQSSAAAKTKGKKKKPLTPVEEIPIAATAEAIEQALQ